MQSSLSPIPVAPHLLPSQVSITPSNTAIPRKRKHSALESSGSGPKSAPSSSDTSTDSKKTHDSEAAALARIADEIRVFNNAYRMKAQMSQMPQTALSAADDEVIRQAQDMLEQDDPDIGDDVIIAIIDIFKTDIRSARMFVRFKRDSLRKCWIRRELQKMNFVLPTP